MYIYRKGRFQEQKFELPQEAELTLIVNGKPMLRLAHSPGEEVELGLGFLWLGGTFDHIEQVRWLQRKDNVLEIDIAASAGRGVPLRTSSCGMGIVYGERQVAELPFVTIAADLPIAIQDKLRQGALQYARTRGIHGAALFDINGRMLHLSEDIGRHNTIDKLAGKILLEDWRPPFLLAVSGRISEEMSHKAAAMGAVLISSRTGATQKGVSAAEKYGVTVCTYVRKLGYRINTSPGRLLASTAREVVDAVGVEKNI